MNHAKVTKTDFRQALGQFATGVTVLTAERAPGHVYGMTANAFASVSLDPLLVLVCVDHRAKMLTVLKEKRRFGVNILRDTQQALSEYFSRAEQSQDAEERLGIRYRWNEDGVPLIGDTLVQLACKAVSTHSAGDHTIFIGAVEGAEVQSGEPLLYFRGQYRAIAP